MTIRSFLESIIARTAKEAINAVRVKKKIVKTKNGRKSLRAEENRNGFNSAIDEAVEKERLFFEEKL